MAGRVAGALNAPVEHGGKAGVTPNARVSGAKRAQAARAAAASQATLLSRLQAELEAVRTSWKELVGLPKDVSTEVVRRLAEAAPALTDLVRGTQPAGVRRLHRNVGLHSCELPAADAPSKQWRQAQNGQRLEVRARGSRDPAPGSIGRARPAVLFGSAASSSITF